MKWIPPLAIAALLALTGNAIVSAPIEASMGIVQKLFYLHVPSAFVMFAAFALAGIAGALFLWRREQRYDALSLAAAEVGLLFCTIVLITGPLWGKIAWGAWWTWEPRLTATLILWLVFLAYFILRESQAPERARRSAAVVALFGSLDIPLIIAAVRLWRGVHPEILRTEGALPPSMRATLLLALVAAGALAAALIVWRFRLARAPEETHG